MVEDWIGTLLRKTSAHEGTFSSVQRNEDGQGASYGILQWTQRGGGLGKVLRAMQAANPGLFAHYFGDNWQGLIAHAEDKDMGPLDGAVLWDEPWLGRFRRAGLDPVMQQAQTICAASSEYMESARAIARILGVSSERAMVLYFNRTVHQGPSVPLSDARVLAAWWAEVPSRRPTTDNGILAQFAWRCASRFRSTAQPTSLQQGTATWKAVGFERDLAPNGAIIQRTGRVWHLFNGPKFDLWDIIIRRSGDILADKSLRDAPVNLAARS